MSRHHLPALINSKDRLLTAAAFQGLADVPPEMEWWNRPRSTSTLHRPSHQPLATCESGE